MSRNQCNICGANYKYIAGRWICPGCGAYKPEELSNEEETLLYNAATRLRVQDFIEAEELYFDIIQKYPKQHEAYWGYVCSRYGVKMEVDFDGKQIPTCCFPNIESFTKDKYFKKAVEYAPSDMAVWYKEQAAYIDRVRAEWIEKAKKEPPYDIFISYKKSDKENGLERTEDAVNALELYIHLARQGYNVFYADESLRDKIGEKYEPYIFQALKTAKIMIVYASSAEYINSTWVKNEWHRYLKQMESGEKREGSLLVVCDGFSPSELPKVLSSKQCLDGKSKKLYVDIDSYLKKAFSKNTTKEEPKKHIKIDPLHEHKYEDEVVPASCIAKGYTVHRCSCGYEYKDNFTGLAEHIYKYKTTKQPTCTADGYKEYVCSECGDSKRETLPATGHAFDKWIDQTRPTCTQEGKAIRQCKVCGYVEEETLAAKGHQWSQEAARIAADGEKEYVSYCRLCGEERVSKETSEERKAKEANKQVRKTKLIAALASGFMTLVFVAAMIAVFVSGEKIGRGIFCIFLAFACGGASVSFTKEYFQLKPIPTEQEKNAKKKRFKRIIIIAIPALLIILALSIFIPTIGRDTYSSKSEMISQLQGWWASDDSARIYRITSDGEVYWSDKAELLEDNVKFNYLTGTLVIGYNKYEVKDGVLYGAGTVYKKAKATDLPTKEISDGTYIYKINDDDTLSLIDVAGYKKLEGELILPSSFDGLDIVSIGGWALEYNDITSVTIPGTIKSIGSCAFSCCFDLETVIMHEGVTSLGTNVFSHCSDIETITIPKSMQDVTTADIGGMWLRTINYNGTKSEWEEFYEKNKSGFDFDGYTITVNCSNGTVTINAK